MAEVEYFGDSPGLINSDDKAIPLWLSPISFQRNSNERI